MAQFIIEADGGSRGNPGPAAYGALVRDRSTHQVLVQLGETIGTATNNVAEYSGLLAGLRWLAEHHPGSSVEVRMDSKLVVEQMAGRWKIKHASMKPLALQAQQLVGQLGDVTWTWVPRAENAAADALANAALDGKPIPIPGLGGETKPASAAQNPATAKPDRGWSAKSDDPTTLILVRHGVTPYTAKKLFSGSGGEDVALTEQGFHQAAVVGDYLHKRGDIDAIVSSPLLRTRQTAASISERLALDPVLEPGLAEVSFGSWDGLSFSQIQTDWPQETKQWLDSTAVAPPGGESFDDAQTRVLAARDRITDQFAGQRVVLVSHVTPIKLLISAAVGAPLSALYRMELSPASISVVSFWPDGGSSLRSFNLVTWD